MKVSSIISLALFGEIHPGEVFCMDCSKCHCDAEKQGVNHLFWHPVMEVDQHFRLWKKGLCMECSALPQT